MRRLNIKAWCFGTVSAVFLATNALAQDKPIDIPAGDLKSGLDKYIQQSGVQLIYKVDDVRGLSTRGAHGVGADPALHELLAGTGLTIHRDSSGALMVSKAIAPKNVEAAPETGAAGANALNLETVVVTGTNIRGVTDTPSPISTFSRDQIDQSGAATVQDFLQKIPQNFGGGASQNSVGAISGDNSTGDFTGGAGVNLRGLGNDATLVLINGIRVAPGNTSGNFVDVSMIPLVAVNRIEIVPDGASAIYGSDAVGGVVNFILRDNYDGEETRLRYGTATEGGGSQYDAAQTVGRDWGSGSALISYDYNRQLSVYSDQRAFSSTYGLPPISLTPTEEQQSVFANGHQDLGADIELFAQGMFSNRKSSNDYNSIAEGLPEQHYTSIANAFGGTLGARWNFAADSEFQTSATYSGTTVTGSTDQAGSGYVYSEHDQSAVISLDAKVDGTLWSGPAGDLKYAIGGQFRSETYRSRPLVGGGVGLFAPSRTVSAFFGELHIPLLGNTIELPGFQSLELDLADRYEKYSDFGTTNNPKVGLIWQVVSELQFKGTYGTSFKAPQLNQLNPLPSEVTPFSLPDNQSPSGATNTLILFGGNPDLKPEKATTFSLTANYDPDWLPGLKMNSTYYTVSYSNRIQNIESAGYNPFLALSQSDLLGPEVVLRNPPLALLQHYYSLPTFEDFTGIPATEIGAVLDLRDQNIGRVSTNGLDFGASYTTTWQDADWQFGLDGTKIFRFDNRLTPTYPQASTLNTTYQPVDLRLRGSVSVTYDKFSLSTFVNYVNGYENNQVAPIEPVGSYTTVDMAVSHDFSDDHSYLEGLRLTVGVTNIADAPPPYVFNVAFPAINYDGANANPVGRLVYVDLSKAW
jgi:iron complex outermembrane recepter protein